MIRRTSKAVATARGKTTIAAQLPTPRSSGQSCPEKRCAPLKLETPNVSVKKSVIKTCQKLGPDHVGKTRRNGVASVMRLILAPRLPSFEIARKATLPPWL